MRSGASGLRVCESTRFGQGLPHEHACDAEKERKSLSHTHTHTTDKKKHNEGLEDGRPFVFKLNNAADDARLIGDTR